MCRNVKLICYVWHRYGDLSGICGELLCTLKRVIKTVVIYHYLEQTNFCNSPVYANVTDTSIASCLCDE